MSTYNLPNFSGGMDSAVVAVASEIPIFSILFLLFVWMFVFVRGVSKQSTRLGYADFPMWATMASLTTFLMSLIMTMKAGLITLDVLGIVLAITILSGVWYFLTSGRLER